MYTSVHVHLYAHTCSIHRDIDTYISKYMPMCVCASIAYAGCVYNVCKCMCTCINVCVQAHTYVCMYVCMYACMYVCIHMFFMDPTS